MPRETHKGANRKHKKKFKINVHINRLIESNLLWGFLSIGTNIVGRTKDTQRKKPCCPSSPYCFLLDIKKKLGARYF